MTTAEPDRISITMLGPESKTDADASESSEAEAEEESSEEQDYYDTDEVHDEVELLLEGTNPEIIELISTDPKRYIDIVENYKKMRDGRDIYLSDLFNILVRREHGQLRIKFKMSDNTQWYEVGYDGDIFTDDDVYKAFTKKVEELRKNPPPARHAQLQDTMKTEMATPKAPVSQGNQNKLTKIDRFLGRVDPTDTAVAPVVGAVAEVQAVESVESVGSVGPYGPGGLGQPVAASSADVSPVQTRIPAVNANQAPVAQAGSITQAEQNAMLDSAVQAYTKQLSERVRLIAPPSASSASSASSDDLYQSLQALAPLCPESMREAYTSLIDVVTSKDPFISGLVTLFPRASDAQQSFLLSFLRRCQWTTHEQLCQRLNLDSRDLELLRAYNIDLTKFRTQ